MKRFPTSFIGLVIISLGGIFILNTGSCGVFGSKNPFGLMGTVYYDAGGADIRYNFSEDKATKMLKGGILNRGFIFSFLTTEPAPYRTFRLVKCNLKGEIIEKGELLPTTHPIWWCCYRDLSPNQSLVAGVRQIDRNRFDRFKIIVSPLSRLEEKVIAEDLGSFKIVWISNKDLLYTDVNGELIQIDVITKEKQKIGYKEKRLYVGTLSPDGQNVLCTKDNNMGSTIYLLDIHTKKLTKIKKYGTSLQGNFIWSPDGKYFVFCKVRPLLLSLLDGSLLDKGLEIIDIYVYSLEDKKAYRLIENTVLFGGFWIDESVESGLKGVVNDE